MDLPSSRQLEAYLLAHPDDLEKMIFVAGPRQVGKTTLSSRLAERLQPDKRLVLSLNWDREEDRLKIRRAGLDMFRELIANSGGKTPVVLFDEIHKFKNWKNFLKGYFDTFRNRIVTFVTGSARLDVYRRGGDSMLGRYWLYRLNPFSLTEGLGLPAPEPFDKFSSDTGADAERIYQNLSRFGGFPEPFLKASPVHHRRWLKMRRERLVSEDLRDLSRIHDLSDVEIFMSHLRESVGSTLSLNSIREAMGVSHNAVKNWLKWLETTYYCFAIPPYSRSIARALKKEPKCYLYDWSELEDPGARFENLIAVHLKKSVEYWNDIGAGDFELFYIRDQQKREVDFFVRKDKKPWLLVESKTAKDEIPKSLIQLGDALNPRHRVLVVDENVPPKYRVIAGKEYWVSGAVSFLRNFV